MNKKKKEQPRKIEGEIWKDIPGYNGRYQLSNMGRMSSGYLSCRKITEYIAGRKQVILTKDDKSLHQINIQRTIVKLFTRKKIDETRVVRWKNGDSSDNRVENLEVLPIKKARKLTNFSNFQPKKVFQFSKKGNFINVYPSITEAAKAYKTSLTNISRALDGTGTAKGFVWRSTKP